MLEAKGIASFRFDFLGSGESDLNFKDMTFKDELACARVILEEALKMENCTEVYVLGHSMGGAVASELANLLDPINLLYIYIPLITNQYIQEHKNSNDNLSTFFICSTLSKL